MAVVFFIAASFVNIEKIKQFNPFKYYLFG